MKPENPSGKPESAARAAAPRRVTSTELLGQGRELLIEHAGTVYRLQLTSTGKLILTK